MGDLPSDFQDLDAELASVWNNVVRDVGERSGVEVDPQNLSIRWKTVRARLIDALRSTAFDRYLDWFGLAAHKELRQKRRANEAEERMFKPLKKQRRGSPI
jgi:hypothetical protein